MINLAFSQAHVAFHFCQNQNTSQLLMFPPLLAHAGTSALFVQDLVLPCMGL